jgi:CDP-4-dehydro-6-deoxyglucose reductase, E3
MIPSEPFDCRLADASLIAPAVRRMVFERASGQPFRFLPGQWVNLVLPLPGGEIKRAYSIASAPRPDDARFEIAVTHVTGGPGSQYLHALPEGATLRAIGPQGLFTRRPDEGAPSIFVGTGTGVTPLRSMIVSAFEAGAGEPLWLLFGARHEDDVLYRDDFAALEAAHPGFRHVVTLSRPGPSWTGPSGYVQAHLPALFRALSEASPSMPHAYVCGLDRMVSSVRDLLRGELGVDRKHVHAERYD